MAEDFTGVCPHCGQPMRKEECETAQAASTPKREIDPRGIPLPRRTRMGGIITPQ